jgi:hypothetical protein
MQKFFASFFQKRRFFSLGCPVFQQRGNPAPDKIPKLPKQSTNVADG